MANDDNKEIETLESAEGRRNVEEHEGGHGEQQVIPEVSDKADIRDLEDISEGLESILAVTPEDLARGRRGAPPPSQQPPGQPTPRTIETTANVETTTNVNIQDVDELIDNLRDQDLQGQSQTQLLQTLAQIGTGLLELTRVMTQTNIQTLDAVFGILEQQEPFSRVVVSGNNSIGNADVAEPVVPDSDQVSIPTRILFIKASEDNDNKITIGDQDISAGSGYVLDKGENWVGNINLDQETLYMIAPEAGETVELMGLR